MRRLMFAAIGLAALASACGMAQADGDKAQAAPNGASSGASNEGFQGRGGFFMRADANNDGVVTREEFAASRVAEFARLDANHDGELSRDEMRAGRHWGGRGEDGGGRGDRLARLDANGDGNISRQEFEAGPSGMFDRLDTNHDGVISAQEREAARDLMAQRIAERRANRPNPDANGDGAISRAEWDAMGASQFQRMDANNDGRVTREEAEAARPRRGA